MALLDQMLLNNTKFKLWNDYVISSIAVFVNKIYGAELSLPMKTNMKNMSLISALQYYKWLLPLHDWGLVKFTMQLTLRATSGFCLWSSPGLVISVQG